MSAPAARTAPGGDGEERAGRGEHEDQAERDLRQLQQHADRNLDHVDAPPMAATAERRHPGFPLKRGLVAHMRRQIKRHGDETDLADLGAAEEELRERRSRKGGRPRRETS
ncbi:MAG: hypothetical protein ACRDPY_34585 [Streptosporangiaceae bacterium]